MIVVLTGILIWKVGTHNQAAVPGGLGVSHHD